MGRDDYQHCRRHRGPHTAITNDMETQFGFGEEAEYYGDVWCGLIVSGSICAGLTFTDVFSVTIVSIVRVTQYARIGDSFNETCKYDFFILIVRLLTRLRGSR